MSERDGGFIPVFRAKAEAFLALRPELQFTWRAQTKHGAYDFEIRGTEPGGFDAMVNVQAYGLYPFLGGRFLGWCWDIVTPGTSVEQMSNQALALVQAVLCPECRLRIKFAGGKFYQYVLEVASPSGWHPVEKLPLSWFHRWRLSRRTDLSEQILQNHLLPPIGLAAGTATWVHFVYERHSG
jgi:hypothetical protein